MPKKPSPTQQTRRKRGGRSRTIPNKKTAAAVATGAIHLANPDRVMFAIEAELEDVNAGNTAVNRYTRVRALIMERFRVSVATASRDMRDAKLWKTERFLAELPFMRAESSEQLQRVADEQESKQPMATIAALREKHSINGLHVTTVSVTGVTPEQQQMLSALMLTPVQRTKRIAALRKESGQVGVAMAVMAARPIVEPTEDPDDLDDPPESDGDAVS